MVCMDKGTFYDFFFKDWSFDMNYGTIISILNLSFWRKKNDHLSALEPPEFFVDDLKLWFTDIPRVFYWGFWEALI